MKKADLIAEARDLVASALGLPEAAVPDNARIYSHPKWDSLGQLQIMLQLEARTRTEVADARTFARLSSVISIASILAARQAETVLIQDPLGRHPSTPASYYRPPSSIGTVVLVHGISADRHEWGLYDLLSLMSLDYELAVLAIDYQGHGSSEVPTSQLSLRGIVSEIENAQRWVSERHSGHRAILGNSFGAGVGLVAGVQLGVDLVGMSCAVTSYEADLARVNANSMAKTSPDGTIPYSGLRLPASIVAEMADIDERLRAVRPDFPVLFFHGTADSDVPCEEARQFAKTMPNSEFYALDNMDHTFTAPIEQKQRDEATVLNREIAASTIAEVLGASARSRT
ncbi:MAG: alpha/beta fold hydrolase [Candidatus Accumulibacter phosphatis]